MKILPLGLTIQSHLPVAGMSSRLPSVAGSGHGFTALLTIAAICLVSWAMPASAERLPVVFVVDAALDQPAFDLTGEILLETSSQLPDDTAFSVIVYDEVIQAIIPLVAMDKSRLANIMRTLENTNPTATSNLAAGFERALDTLKETQAGHIVFFTSALINVQADEQRKQYLEWYEEILLPDSALKDLAITIVSPADTGSNRLLQVTASYQHIEILPMTGNGKTSGALLAKFAATGAPVAAGADPVATVTNAASTTGSAPDAQNQEPTKTVQNADQEVAPSRVVTAPVASNKTNFTTTISQRWLGYWREKNTLLFAIAGAVILLLAGLLAKFLRGSKYAVPAVAETDTTGKSAYLPLDEDPSGRLATPNYELGEPDESHNNLTFADEEARWTNKWTGHADAPVLASTSSGLLASEDTTHISVNKPLPADEVMEEPVAEVMGEPPEEAVGEAMENAMDEAMGSTTTSDLEKLTRIPS